MELARPEFVPDPDASRTEMKTLQLEIAGVASFGDASDLLYPGALSLDEPFDLNTVFENVSESKTVGSTSDAADAGPIVVGIDQAFLDEEAVSAAVAIQGDRIIEVACGRTPLEIPYIPGLLAFREGGPMIDGLQSLSVDPDLLVVDGNGRIHYRQAGIATHIGVLFDVPAVGVAKNLLCGTPARDLSDPLPAGTRIEITANEEMTADSGTTVGYAYQSRQFPNPERRHVNPIFVSPGHLVGAETAVNLLEGLCAGYKLPEPIRLADRAAAECKD